MTMTTTTNSSSSSLVGPMWNATTDDMIQELIQSPVYMPQEYLQETCVPAVLWTTVAVSILYSLALPVARKLDPSASSRQRLAYQITNAVFNSFLGFLGLYFYTTLPSDLSPAQKIEGWHEFYILGALQVGFQIWAIVVGILFVNESPEMLIHHVAVIMAATKGIAMTNGFRYYAPVAMGMTELSSVPLSVMNSFKNNAQWRESYPSVYQASRIIFSLCFLTIRIGIFVPQHLEYLQYAFLMNYYASAINAQQHVGYLYRVWMGFSWLGAVFLLLLQLYWGYLIVMGLYKALIMSSSQHKIVVKKKNL